MIQKQRSRLRWGRQRETRIEAVFAVFIRGDMFPQTPGFRFVGASAAPQIGLVTGF
jgi:hypothetical protein